MSAPKHTPGPWSVSMPSGQDAFNGRRVTVTHNGSMIADLDWNSPQENMANAALIASAPELAARIAALDELLAEKQRQCDKLTDACERALMVIASASPSHPETVKAVRAALAERRAE